MIATPHLQRPPCRSRFVALALTALCATLPCAAQTLVPGYPDDVYEGDAREMAMIPEYCAHTQVFRDHVPGGNDKEKVKRWYSILGDTFHHLHHYCAGIIKTNRAVVLSRTGVHRKFYLRDAIVEYDYVLRSAPPNYVLLPEILTKKAENLVRLGEGPMALSILERAIQLKPDYWPPYAVLGDYYASSGKPAKAREVLAKGLAAAPGTQALTRRLTALDDPKARTPAVRAATTTRAE